MTLLAPRLEPNRVRGREAVRGDFDAKPDGCVRTGVPAPSPGHSHPHELKCDQEKKGDKEGNPYPPPRTRHHADKRQESSGDTRACPEPSLH